MRPSESLVYVTSNPWGSRGPMLKFDVCNHKDPMQVAWTCTLMEVYEHERALDQGRFANFRAETRANAVAVLVNNREQPWMRSVADRVNWIAEHTDSPWSMALDVLNVQEARFYFSFDDLAIATMFKLVFG